MKLTPLDIRKQDFDRSLRGYDPDDVEAFLDMVATQWEEVVDERRRLEKEVEELEGQLDHYRQVEEALQEALNRTRENAEQQIENARQKAENIVKEAEAEAEEIKRKARAKRDRLESEAQELERRRREVVARLRGFLNSELEILEEFDELDPKADKAIGEELDSSPELPAAEAELPETGASEPPSEPVAASGPGAPPEESVTPDLAEVSDEEEESSADTKEVEGTQEEPSIVTGQDAVEEEPAEESSAPAEVSAEKPERERPEPGGTGGESATPTDLLSDEDPAESEADPEPSFGEETEPREESLGQVGPFADAAAETRSETDADPFPPQEPEEDPQQGGPVDEAADESEDRSEGEEEKKKRSRSGRDATSEEIEKIWSILEDME